jgi:uncharacterized membrane protein YczE
MSALRSAAGVLRRPLLLGPRTLPRRLARVAIGGAMIGLGAALMIRGELGVTPWDVLVTATSERADISVGIAGGVLAVLLYLACMPFGRFPGWGNLVLLVVISVVVDAGLAVIDTPAPLVGQLAMFAGGVLVLSGGVGLIVAADIGVGPLEMVMLVATDRGAQLTRIRPVIEGTTLAVGWMLGGAMGVGTVVFALVVGHLIELSLRVQGVLPSHPADPRTPASDVEPASC